MSKTFSKRRKHPAECVAKLEAVAMQLPLSKSQIRKEPGGGASLLLQAQSFDYKMLAERRLVVTVEEVHQPMSWHDQSLRRSAGTLG
jgi:hypothetical protein